MKSKTRVLSSIVLLPILILAIFKLPHQWFAVFLAVGSALAYAEFCLMYKLDKVLMITGVFLPL